MNINFAEIANIKERRKWFLFDTVNFYNSENRAQTEDGMCFYRPMGDSPGCAIGRHLDRDSEVLVNNLSGIVESLCIKLGKDWMPQWMYEMGTNFLQTIQNFHDSEECWNKNGLTSYGKDCLNSILLNFC